MNYDQCYICYTNEITDSTNYLINSLCLCKTKIHIKCLIKMIKLTRKTFCSVCKKSFNAYYDFKNRIIFPFDNIYYIPLLTDQIVILDSNDYFINLQYAIINRIDNKIKQILNTINDDDYIRLKNNLQNQGPTIPYDILYKNNENVICIWVNTFASYYKCDLETYTKYINDLFYNKEQKYLENLKKK